MTFEVSDATPAVVRYAMYEPAPKVASTALNDNAVVEPSYASAALVWSAGPTAFAPSQAATTNSRLAALPLCA